MKAATMLHPPAASSHPHSGKEDVGAPLLARRRGLQRFVEPVDRDPEPTCSLMGWKTCQVASGRTCSRSAVAISGTGRRQTSALQAASRGQKPLAVM
jgi:hypothetical protein